MPFDYFDQCRIIITGITWQCGGCMFIFSVTVQGRTLGFEFAAALVLGRELDEQTRDELSQHYANVIKAFFTIPVSCHLLNRIRLPRMAVCGL